MNLLFLKLKNIFILLFIIAVIITIIIQSNLDIVNPQYNEF